ncbi:unnamed protein product, partial [Lymnaea stagnalis]
MRSKEIESLQMGGIDMTDVGVEGYQSNNQMNIGKVVIETEQEVMVVNEKLDDEEKKPSAETDAVPDGGYGWIVVLGCFIAHIIIGGFERNDGIYYLQFKSRFEKSAQLTSWPGALVSTIRLFLGPVASAVCSRFSVRSAVIIGSLLMTVAQILNAYAPDFYFLFFSHSALQGLGRGLVYAPSVIIAGMYFDKHRGLAAGLGSSGVGVGTFCIVPLTQWLFDNYGFEGTFLILGGVALNGLVVAMLYRPLSLHYKFTRKNSHPQQCVKKDGWFISSLKICFPIENKSQKKSGKKNLFHFSLLKDSSFFMFCVSIMLFTAAFKAAFTFIPALVKSKGLTESEAALVLSITGVFDTIGRIVAGVLFDLRGIRQLRPVFYNSLIFAIAGISFILPSMTSFAALSVLCSVYGSLTGAYISQKSVVIVDILGVQNMSASFGLLVFFQAIGMCVGPPLSG